MKKANLSLIKIHNNNLVFLLPITDDVLIETAFNVTGRGKWRKQYIENTMI